MENKILIVDDEKDIRWILQTSLEKSGFDVDCSENGQDAVCKACATPYSLLLLDINMQDLNGFEVLAQLRDSGIDTPVIFITAENTPNNAIDSIRLGAYDYLTKPFDLDEVRLLTQRAIRNYTARKKIKRSVITEQDGSLREIVGNSPKMLDIYKLVGRTAERDVTVLITGESGTGKEVIAKSIHNNSSRRKKRLVSVNISAIPRELIESELFGYEKGAFTGANSLKKGRFEEAEGGTLHMDEIGELSVGLQSKLLRAIEENQIYRLGSEESVPINVRIVASTNKNLKEAVSEGTFREDLFYRLNVINIFLPPLRERREEISELAEHFLDKYSSELTTERKILSPEAGKELAKYNWPGNVRELENTIKRLLILNPDTVISANQVKKAVESETVYEKQSLESEAEKIIRNILENMESPLNNVYEKVIGKFEKQLIEIMLAKTNGNAQQAALTLGINRNTLAKKIKELGVKKE